MKRLFYKLEIQSAVLDEPKMQEWLDIFNGNLKDMLEIAKKDEVIGKHEALVQHLFADPGQVVAFAALRNVLVVQNADEAKIERIYELLDQQKEMVANDLFYKDENTRGMYNGIETVLAVLEERPAMYLMPNWTFKEHKE